MEFARIDKSTDNNIRLSSDVEKCCICLEDCNEKLLLKTKCNHFFHSQCLFMWIIQDNKQKKLLECYDDVVPLNGQCPLCRCNISQIFDLKEHDNYKPNDRTNGVVIRTKDYIIQRLVRAFQQKYR